MLSAQHNAPVNPRTGTIKLSETSVRHSTYEQDEQQALYATLTLYPILYSTHSRYSI